MKPLRVVSILLSICLISLLLVIFPTHPAQAQQPDEVPMIITFNAPVTVVSRSALEARTARIAVSWETVNRPVWANLFFEQVMPSGVAINVELPRWIPWVASSGVGVVAPLWPGEGQTSVNLRVRLVNLITGVTLSERYLSLTITAEPTFTRFTTRFASIDRRALEAHTALIPVTWSVENRPNNSNLVFEQVFPDGRYVNVELPRSIPYVASAGDGVVAPWYVPLQKQILIRVRLIDTTPGSTRVYATRELTVLVVDSEPVTPVPSVEPPITPVPTVRIVSFSANPAEVKRQSTITFSWIVEGAVYISLEALGPVSSYHRLIGHNLPTSGTLDYIVPVDAIEPLNFRLTASTTDRDAVNTVLTVPIRCPITPVFSTGCPDTQLQTNMAVQLFERGQMFWRGDTRSIYVLFDNYTWAEYPDTYSDGDALLTDQPPAGLLAPIRGFGKLWSSDAAIREGLGWATTAEQAYTSQVEDYRRWRGQYYGVDHYFRTPDGRTVRLDWSWKIE